MDRLEPRLEQAHLRPLLHQLVQIRRFKVRGLPENKRHDSRFCRRIRPRGGSTFSRLILHTGSPRNQAEAAAKKDAKAWQPANDRLLDRKQGLTASSNLSDTQVAKVFKNSCPKEGPRLAAQQPRFRAARSCPSLPHLFFRFISAFPKCAGRLSWYCSRAFCNIARTALASPLKSAGSGLFSRTSAPIS